MSVKPCVGCDETVDALYCSHSCFQEDDGRVMESPVTGELYYVTEWEERGESKFVAHRKEKIAFGDVEGSDGGEGA